jgi:replicative DNA helicase
VSDGLKLLAAIVDNGSVSALRELDEALLLEDERRALAYIRQHYRRYRALPDIRTVETDVALRIPDPTEPPAYYLQKIRDRHLYEQMRDGYTRLKTCLRNYDMGAAREVIDLLSTATRHATTGRDLLTLGESTSLVVDAYDVAHQNPGISGIPTGWGRFDNITGGYQKADLITWVGRPSMGKTTLLLSQAWQAWMAGYSVLCVTMEMSIEQITRRMLALPTGINPSLIRRGMLSVYAEERLRNVIESLSGTSRFHMFSGGLKKKTSDVELLAQEYTPDIVLCDGVYLMQPSARKSMSKVERASDLFDELKQMTLTQNVPLVVTSQFNRQAGKKGKDGSLENIAYTDAISTHSSIVVAINSHDDGDNKRLLTFLKGREGESGAVGINYIFTPPDFSELAADDPQPATGSSQGLDWMVGR